MLNYRRDFVPGGCWFFTVNLLERRTTMVQRTGELGRAL
jgi:putative transposase